MQLGTLHHLHHCIVYEQWGVMNLHLAEVNKSLSLLDVCNSSKGKLLYINNFDAERLQEKELRT